MDMAVLAQAFTGVLGLIISLSFHEAAHALIAKWQGDDTAEREGRLTLNPVPHIDPMGTLFLPIMAALLQIPVMLGWAKPVPIDPRNFRDQRWGSLWVALAGPVSNLLLSAVCLVAVALYYRHLTEAVPQGSFLFPIVELLKLMVFLNAVLAVFNLIPLPPLDGGAVLSAFLPPQLGEAYQEYVAPYGSIILLALLFTGGLSWIGFFAVNYVRFIESTLGRLF